MKILIALVSASLGAFIGAIGSAALIHWGARKILR